jgi:hypothetical protein
VVAGTTAECSALACVRLIDVGSDSHCGGGDDCRGRCSVLCSLVRRGLKQSTLFWGRQLKALLWPVFAFSTWAQTATVVVGTTAEGAALACVRLFDVGSDSH